MNIVANDELQVLRSIFVDDFTEVSDNLFSIRVSAFNCEGRSNNVEVFFKFSFPPDYPNQQQNNFFSLELAKGIFNSRNELLFNIQQKVAKATISLIGQPMIFGTIEILRELLEDLEEWNTDCMLGTFMLLNDELIFHIFEYLEFKELSSIMQVSRNFFRIASDQRLWKQLCIKEFSSRFNSNYIKEEENWILKFKQLYKDIEYSIPISGFVSKIAVQKILKKSLFSIQLEVFGEVIYERGSRQPIGTLKEEFKSGISYFVFKTVRRKFVANLQRVKSVSYQTKEDPKTLIECWIHEFNHALLQMKQ